jgi:hypothetical protein
MKKQFKVLTETNKVKFINAYNKQEVRLKMYQLVGSENFTIKQL